jgi:hypothetical protein
MTESEGAGNDRPPYSYVPGGPWPHPIGDPGGHSFGRRGEVIAPIVGDDWRGCPAYLRGVALFNDGYYWEAHEAWELVWHAHGRKGPIADVVRALIKLAAAGVKVREGQPGGVSIHATRAAALLEATASEVGPRLLGLDLRALAGTARRLAERPPTAATGKEAAVAVVFEFRIEPA